MRIIGEVKDFKLVCVKFAIWNARRCLRNYQKVYPKDFRVRDAIIAAEKYVINPNEENRSAARSAASAAESAAESAAWSAQEKKFARLIKEQMEKRI